MSAIFTTFATPIHLQNYDKAETAPQKGSAGSFYNTWGLAFVLIFLFLFQLIFYFLAVFTAGLIFGIEFKEVQNLLTEPDGTALAINLARYTNVVTFTGYMLLPGLMFALVNKTGVIREGGLKTPLRGNIILLCLLMVALAIPLVDFMTGWLQAANLPEWLDYYARYFQNTREESLNTILDMERPAELVFCLFALGLLPALFEEFLFRGVLLNIFRYITGRKVLPVILQAAVFAFLHLTVYEFPGILLMGILFGLIAMRTGTIWYGVILHFMFNATSIVFTWMNQEAFRQNGVYGEYQTIAFTPLLAVAAVAGLIILYRLFKKVTVEVVHE